MKVLIRRFLHFVSAPPIPKTHPLAFETENAFGNSFLRSDWQSFGSKVDPSFLILAK